MSVSPESPRRAWSRLRAPVLGLLAALCLPAIVFWVSERRASAVERSGYAFAHVSADDVSALTVHYLDDSMTVFREGTAWFTAPDRFPADTARVGRSLRNLLGLRTFDRVSDSADESRLAEYALQSGKAKRVELQLKPDGVLRVELGKISGVDYGSVYWKFQDSPEVYRTPGQFIWDIPSRAVDWKDTTLHARFTGQEVRAVETAWLEPSGKRNVFRIERTEDTSYMLTEPFNAPVQRQEAENVFRHAARFRIDGFVPVPDTSASRADLDRPFMTVRVDLKDGTRREVVAGAVVDDLYRYVRHPSHPDPVRVFTWRFDYFRKRPEELVGGTGKQ